jgi:lysozyme
MTNLTLSAVGRKFIESWERLFLQAYDDATEKVVKPGQKVKGTITIGYGHTTSAGPPRIFTGMKITEAEADAILAHDLAHVEADVNRVVKVTVTQSQFDALVSFHFNTGWLTHANCSLLKALNKGNYDLAEKDFALYNKSGGKVMRGLVRRRAAEMAMFKTGAIIEA